MKKMFLLLLIMISLPVYAQVPSSMPGTYEQQAAPTLPPLQVLQRKILKGWVKENTNEDGSNRTSFLSDEDIQGVDEDIQGVDEELSSNSQEVKDFNNTINKEPPLQKEPSLPEIEKSTTIPDNANNWTEEEARENLFKNAVYKKDFRAIPIKDPYYKENMLTMKSGEVLIDNRLLTMFSNNCYAVLILTDDLYDKAFHYNQRGKLEKIVYYYYPKHIYNLETFVNAMTKDSTYPYRKSYYTVSDGSLAATGITTIKMSYIFNVDKSLNCYWKDNKGYTPDGTLFMTKKTIKY